MKLSTIILPLVAFFIAIPDLCYAQDGPCLNDPNFTFYYAGQNRSCQNIRVNALRQSDMCIIPAVQQGCKQTCGLCCVDIPGYEFQLKRRNQGKVGCDWLRENQDRKDSYCRIWRAGSPTFYGRTGMMVRDACPFSCDFCQPQFLPKVPTITPGNPTPNPTVSPTKPPTVSPTVSTQRPSYDCVNDDDYFVQGNRQATCMWIGEDEERRKRFCANPETQLACPQICGACCADSKDYKIETYLNTRKGCRWIGAQSNRKRRYCKNQNRGRLVRAACPVSCDFCFEYASTSPIMAP
uniref:ShKT domain-containing protein n=1 Tax=Chaetoceros debilis TaxID=122233 RepID=A0A7S3Q406_9STRA|mmetsp:Transcript_3165/g.4660  ORF Transcript_3165/g.4660 Transcript_3165/m.4660 type:complete len:294 (+) Transcript_3165:146-1027(+)|eukprot:CAMPEP_0194107632 /NCGR_PEP_ID=MMETSP0150-20130528/7484_1 /TAXON_ID=122233 /ORGANISM="Chaetoceros debilis, Strain MM31A-1" /LENGTH=293 /DNA_ID=CAMNT_0038796115 /DNA_START=103 /DNA_END=984 /DNA_ORIENTATION=+